ncbi:MAG: dinitrogenase iron-molybdenum cofactor biosynthesis protein [Firmicutes bacterium]|nr:dinitrogenase iron-molybdenum cofactor biosynthesis protein [Bacillota bacterium]
MKVAVSAQGRDLAAEVDSRFGRCSYFIIVDLKKDEVEVVANSPGPGGAGVAAAQLMAQREVEAVITGNLGPKAGQGLTAAGISVYRSRGGTVQENLEALKAGELEKMGNPTVAGRFGSQG